MSVFAPWKDKAAGELVARMFTEAWRPRGTMTRSNGDHVACYDFEADPRIGCTIESRKGKTARRYFFADDGVIEVEQLVPPLIGDEGAEFRSIEDLAIAVVEHDDARAWYRAGPAPRIDA